MIKRRRVLSILAGAAALPVVGGPAVAKSVHWRGVALGAEARIILDHKDASGLISKAVAEIRRLENIFSLYRKDSQLSILNREGSLTNPAFELVELLSVCSQINLKTAGAFDPTVQTLWSLYAEQYSKGEIPSPTQIAWAKSVTGWQYVRYSPLLVEFTRKGVALTLNGIAQGFIADRVRDLFKRNGVSNVMVNTGEISALGTAPDGKRWRVQLRGAKDINLPLSNGAIATSSPLGTAFDEEGSIGHILDPRTGEPGGVWSEVSVIANSAALADGLSTGFCLMNESQIMHARGDVEVRLR